MTTTAHRRILRDVLAWTQLQARILTAHGRANAYYTDFKPEELPHHLLRRGTMPILTKTAPAWAVGCWARPLFSGGGRATADDRVRNVQGLTHFVDVRMPKQQGPRPQPQNEAAPWKPDGQRQQFCPPERSAA